MAENSEISWTTHTANFWWGCVEVSALCDHCYAKMLAARFGRSVWGPDAPRWFTKSVWKDLDKWQKEAAETGVRPRVFVMSMGDFFEHLPEEHQDKSAMELARSMAMLNMEDRWRHLDFLVLTKRISNAAKMVRPHWLTGGWPANVRLGISVGTQKDADRDIPRLMELPAPNFLSMEPLLEQVSITDYLQANVWDTDSDGKPFRPWPAGQRVQWVITGGESGPHARPSHPAWFRLLRDQCQSAGVPFHFKQWGEFYPLTEHTPDALRTGASVAYGLEDGTVSREAGANCEIILRPGKKAAGRLLDGVLHEAFPEATRS